MRRLPIRRDLYSATDRQHMSDPDANPYAEVDLRSPAGTDRPRFDLIRSLFRCSILDPLPELHAAWNAILANGGPEQNPEAMAALTALPFPYAKAGEAARAIIPINPDNTPFSIMRQQREWTEFFRRQYLQAKALAEHRPAHP